MNKGLNAHSYMIFYEYNMLKIRNRCSKMEASPVCANVFIKLYMSVFDIVKYAIRCISKLIDTERPSHRPK